MPSTDKAKDRNPFAAPTKRMAKGKKKPARKTGTLGTPKKKAVAKRKTKKTSR